MAPPVSAVTPAASESTSSLRPALQVPQAEPVWVLLGSKRGDNSQLLALADSLGLPHRALPLRFNVLHWLPPALLGASRCNLKDRRLLDGPAPKLVLSSGRRSVAAARWLRQQAGAGCRLVHVGRPWGPLRWFDLIITTPQYALPAADNVQHNLLPMLDAAPPPPEPVALSERFARLPRPWTVVILGGPSRPLVLTPDVAKELARQLDREQAERGGSLMVVASPRTPAGCVPAMQPLLRGPHALYAWGEPDNPYTALRAQADRFVVTDDSVQMLSELLLSGRPVQVFPLPERPDLLMRLVRAWARAAEQPGWRQRCFHWARDRGLLASLRSVSLFHRQLAAAGALGNPERVRELTAIERQTTLERVRRLLPEA